jgi:hypothetical protein
MSDYLMRIDRKQLKVDVPVRPFITDEQIWENGISGIA